MIDDIRLKDLANINLPDEVHSVLKETVELVAEYYGDDRNRNDMGGYSVVIEALADYDILKLRYLDIYDCCPEYVDIIVCSDGSRYISLLVLLNSDYGVHMIIPYSLVPDKIIQETESDLC